MSETLLPWQVGLFLISKETLDFSCPSPAGMINCPLLGFQFAWHRFLFHLIHCSKTFSLQLFIPVWNSLASPSYFYISKPVKHGVLPWSQTTSDLLRWKFCLTHPYFSVRVNPSTKDRWKCWRRELWGWGAQMTQTWKCRLLIFSLDLCGCSLQTRSMRTYVSQLTWLIAWTLRAPIIFQELPSLVLGTLWGCVSSSIFLSLACCVWMIHTRHSRFQQNALSETAFVSHCSDVHAFTACGGTKLLIFVLVCYFKVMNNFSYWKNSISLLQTLQSEPRQFLTSGSPLSVPWIHHTFTSTVLLPEMYVFKNAQLRLSKCWGGGGGGGGMLWLQS